MNKEEIKKYLPHREPFLFVDTVTNLNNENELEDLYSLSQCDGIIMSNSSFAWWGTYLGKNKYKVVSPSIWFNPSSPDLITTDLYKDEWIKI